MSITLEQAAISIQANRERLYKEREFQQRTVAAVGQKMVELIADPRWQTFANHVEALAEGAENAIKANQDRLLNTIVTGDEYIKLKVQLTGAENRAMAYRTVIKMVTNLIETGEKAEQGLTNEAKPRL